MRTVRLLLAYDGTHYAGWQWQPSEPSVQGALEAAIQQITGEALRVAASGRTDAGVHAAGQVVSFGTDSQLEPAVLERALNAVLPHDIRVLAAREAPAGFHARKDAVAKRYRYTIDDGPVPEVFRRHYAWHVPQRLDDVAMQQAAEPLIGRHDFSSFECSGSPRATSLRTVSALAVVRAAADMLHVEIAADGFLYNMVRNIVGTLVEVGRGKRAATWPG